jgi:hypothetical protein
MRQEIRQQRGCGDEKDDGATDVAQAVQVLYFVTRPCAAPFARKSGVRTVSSWAELGVLIEKITGTLRAFKPYC